MAINQCTYWHNCNQIKQSVCTSGYEHCTIHARFVSLNTIPKEKADLPKNLEGVTYDEWLGVGAMINLPGGSADNSTNGK